MYSLNIQQITVRKEKVKVQKGIQYRYEEAEG
jgi:hypothetical protein